MLAAHPKVLKEPPVVYGVSGLGDSSIDISVKPWIQVQDYPTATGELYLAIVEAFERNHIDMPFPQREIRILNESQLVEPRRTASM